MGEAIDLTSKLYPGLLDKDANLMFALKCRQFVEMVNGTDSEIYRGCTENHTSVIQSTKFLLKSSTNSNLGECNTNSTINGSNDPLLLNGQIEDDVEMEDTTFKSLSSTKIVISEQHNISNSNGFKHRSKDDVEMGMYCNVY